MCLGAATAHLLGLTVMQWSCAGTMSGICLERSCPPSFSVPFPQEQLWRAQSCHGQSTGRRAAMLNPSCACSSSHPGGCSSGRQQGGCGKPTQGLNANAENFGCWVRGAENGRACASAERNVDLLLGPCVDILHARIAFDHLHHTDAQSMARSQHWHCHASNCPRC